MILAHLSKRERNILYFCLSLTLVFLTYNFIFEPAQKKIDDLNQKVEVKKVKLEKNLSVLSRKEMIERRYAKYSKSLQARGTDEEELAAFLSEIENLAQKNGLHISDMKPRPAKTVDFYKKFTVDLQADGDIKQITQFIYQLQNDPKLLRVDRLRLETKSQSQNLTSYMLISKITIQ